MLSFFQQDVLDEIWDLVSEGFLPTLLLLSSFSLISFKKGCKNGNDIVLFPFSVYLYTLSRLCNDNCLLFLTQEMLLSYMAAIKK